MSKKSIFTIIVCLLAIIGWSYYIYSKSNIRWISSNNHTAIIKQNKPNCNKIIGHYSGYLFISDDESATDGFPAVAFDPITYKKYTINRFDAWYFIDSSVFSWEYTIGTQWPTREHIRLVWDTTSQKDYCEEHIMFNTWVFKEINRHTLRQFYDIIDMPDGEENSRCKTHTSTGNGIYRLSTRDPLYAGTYGIIESFFPVEWKPKHRFYLINSISKQAQETINKDIFWSWTVRVYDRLVSCGETMFDFPYCTTKDINRCIGFIDLLEWEFGDNPIYRR